MKLDIAYMTENLPQMKECLAAVGCTDPDPATLAMSVWRGEPFENGLPPKAHLAFLALYAEACRFLGADPDPVDLRPIAERSAFEQGELVGRYRWVLMAVDRLNVDTFANLVASQTKNVAAVRDTNH